MNGTRAQSWNDLAIMDPMDPRSIISIVQLEDQAGSLHTGTFLRSTTWLHPGAWINPPMAVSIPPASQSNLVCLNGFDFNSVMLAQNWNAVNQMTVPNGNYPVCVQRIMYGHPGSQFVNNYYLDFLGGATSTDIQLSLRDNSTTSGNFENAALGTIPVFTFLGSPTFGGTGRNLQLTFLRTGRFQMALRIIDNGGNYSLFEMDFIVL